MVTVSTKTVIGLRYGIPMEKIANSADRLGQAADTVELPSKPAPLQPTEIAGLKQTGNMYCEGPSYRCVHLETVTRKGRIQGDCWYYDVMVGTGEKRFPRCADCVKYKGRLPEVLP